MKRRILSLLSLILILALMIYSNGFGLFNQKTAYAVGDLNVIWGVPDGDPIFVVSNMLPGDMEDRDVDVENNAPTPRPVGVRGIKTEEIASFSAVLDFIVSEGGSDLYGGTSPTGPKTLEEFFDESSGPNGIFLSTINNGDTTTYNFKATFPQGSSDEFQGAKVVFDLQIGISIDLPDACENINFNGNTMFGTSGADALTGTSRNDLIIGFEGNDVLSGGGGNDCLIGGSGQDILNGGSGNDVHDGGSQKDIINGGSGNDQIDGGLGNDFIDAGSNNDTVLGNGGNDDINGGSGDDNLVGGLGIDKIRGGSGTDTCDGETEFTCEL